MNNGHSDFCSSLQVEINTDIASCDVNDFSEKTLAIPAICKMLSQGKINIQREQTFWLKFYRDANEMHQSANDYIKGEAKENPDMIFLPYVGFTETGVNDNGVDRARSSDNYIHVVGFYHVLGKEEKESVDKGFEKRLKRNTPMVRE